MKDLKLWVDNGGVLQLAEIIPAVGVGMLLGASEHESGHAIVAQHLGAKVRGIAIISTDNPQSSFVLACIYEWQKPPSVEAQCVTFAAGPAAQALYGNGFTDMEAQGDLANIAQLTGVRSLEPHLTKAKTILVQYETQLRRLATELRRAFETEEQLEFDRLGGNFFGWMLFDEEEVMRCLTA